MASKKEFEKRVSPEVLRVLLVGESVRVSGYAMTQEGKQKGELFTFGAIKRLRHYWVVVTDQRLILVSMGHGPINRGAEFERAESLANVEVIDTKRIFTGEAIRIRVGDAEYALRFTGRYKQVARALHDLHQQT